MISCLSSVTATVETQQMRWWKTFTGWQSSHIRKTGNGFHWDLGGGSPCCLAP